MRRYFFGDVGCFCFGARLFPGFGPFWWTFTREEELEMLREEAEFLRRRLAWVERRIKELEEEKA
ncbi:MAG: hypothetical protein H5U36_09360 [Candidatus Caldatribacterium sp.]|nr:hypothetical protein [Candidatus Caldatribacterium sp.]